MIPTSKAAMRDTATAAVIPNRPLCQWPVGARLRFRPDAELHSHFEDLRGKPVIVLSGMRLIGPTQGRYSWRQQILALPSCKVGWARPDQLGLPVDGDEAEGF